MGGSDMDMSLLQKPAKDLSNAEAFDVLIYLYDTDEIKLTNGVKRDPNDPDKIVSPKPGEQVRVGMVMGDVTFRHASDAKRPKGGAEGWDTTADFNPTPAFAVLLYRMGVLLHDQWQVTTIVCGGVGIGGGRSATDSHTQGRAIDFYGVVRTGGATIDVHRDWFVRPVSTAIIDEDGTSMQYDAVGDDKWGGDDNTYFRLTYSTDAQDETPRRFFNSVYEFVAKESTTGTNDISAENFRRGVLLGKGYIFHPDYPHWGSWAPGDAGRQSHHDHMHFQLGT
jgi:hypothetical protein